MTHQLWGESKRYRAISAYPPIGGILASEKQHEEGGVGLTPRGCDSSAKLLRLRSQGPKQTNRAAQVHGSRSADVEVVVHQGSSRRRR
jgi:hypothetical protein